LNGALHAGFARSTRQPTPSSSMRPRVRNNLLR